jgi:hypothetical protein
MPSSIALGTVAQNPNNSTNALSQVPTRLAPLEEDVQLQPATSSSSSSSDGAAKAEPSRLKKVSSAVQTGFGLWGNKDKGKHDVEADPNAAPTKQTDQGWQYTSNMVDVLDTVGE